MLTLRKPCPLKDTIQDLYDGNLELGNKKRSGALFQNCGSESKGFGNERGLEPDPVRRMANRPDGSENAPQGASALLTFNKLPGGVVG
jgi:hypothetical protein